MFHGHLDCFPKPPLGGRPNTKPWDHGTPKAHNLWFTLFYHGWGPACIEIHRNNIWWRNPITFDFTLHLRVRDHTYMTLEVSWDGLGTLSCGLSQSHGQGSRLVREMALKHILPKFIITHLSGAHLDWIVTLGPKLRIEWVSGDVFGIIGQDSSLPKSSYQVVMIFQFSSVTLRYILYRFLSNDCNFPEVLNLNRLFLKHNRFTCS